MDDFLMEFGSTLSCTTSQTHFTMNSSTGGGQVVERQTFGRRDLGSKPPPSFRSLGNFIYPNLSVSFERDSKTCWSLLSGVYARESKIPHA